MQIPTLVDMIQQTDGNLEVPEIRIWCHPHIIDASGDDYFRVFSNFNAAVEFIKTHPEAEKQPLIAFRGYEINLWEMKEAEKKK